MQSNSILFARLATAVIVCDIILQAAKVQTRNKASGESGGGGPQLSVVEMNRADEGEEGSQLIIAR